MPIFDVANQGNVIRSLGRPHAVKVPPAERGMKVMWYPRGTRNFSVLEEIPYSLHWYDSDREDKAESDRYFSQVSRGEDTDFASVPWFARWLLNPTGEWGRAAVVHDHLYLTGELTRAQADYVFLEIMRQDGVSFGRRWAIYAAVRAFGWKRWRERRRVA